LPIAEYGFFEVAKYSSETTELHSFILMNVLSPNVHSCSEFVSNSDMLSTEFTYILLKKIARACLALETDGIVHGDFHWGNIIVSVKNAYIDIPFKKLTDDQFDIILIDFGFSTALIPELKHYDLNSLYISSLSYPNNSKFRSRLRKLMMKRTSISESILLDIQSFYKMYAKQKEILFQKLNLD
ncbi:MAG: AarF/UbiB family protein, partial [bacterium]